MTPQKWCTLRLLVNVPPPKFLEAAQRLFYSALTKLKRFCTQSLERSRFPFLSKYAQRKVKPTIVCLCGSTRFIREFREANLRETLGNKIVLSIGCDFKSAVAQNLPPETKERLDELHKRKIDIANEILVLDVKGYIGSSTRSEIEYAIAHGKKVRYLSLENFRGRQAPPKPYESRVVGKRPCEKYGRLLRTDFSERKIFLNSVTFLW